MLQMETCILMSLFGKKDQRVQVETNFLAATAPVYCVHIMVVKSTREGRTHIIAKDNHAKFAFLNISTLIEVSLVLIEYTLKMKGVCVVTSLTNLVFRMRYCQIFHTGNLRPHFVKAISSYSDWI